jgi:1-deoxy-D-xylulose-5-phosphate reductoisomerase
MVEFRDGSVIAQMGVPDMRLPIQYAVTYPDRIPSDVQRLDLTTCGSLTFYPPDPNFICLETCKESLRRGGLSSAAANGANEMAVQLFMEGKISFLEIGTLVRAAMENQPKVDQVTSVAQVLEADRMARAFVRETAGV